MSDRSQVDSQNVVEAARRAMEVSTVLRSLCRFAYTAEDHQDFEAFHSLMYEILPTMGLKLDETLKSLGHTVSGGFANGTLSGMFSSTRN